MKLLIPFVLTLPLLAGCSGLGRVAIDSGAGAAGGLLGNTLSHGDPWITAAGAAGGVLVAEGGQAIAANSQQKSFKRGVEAGRAQATKEFYWDLQARHRFPRAQ